MVKVSTQPFDYLSDNSMDMGTVWLIEDVK